MSGALRPPRLSITTNRLKTIDVKDIAINPVAPNISTADLDFTAHSALFCTAPFLRSSFYLLFYRHSCYYVKERFHEVHPRETSTLGSRHRPSDRPFAFRGKSRSKDGGVMGRICHDTKSNTAAYNSFSADLR